ncbi:unnamed protein product [Didymodactylos carnosus]|uniref:Uncharacterized protein n=1 Tax=Didymodactylos carnosus TaxID=1234261 RepID=A0A813RZK0_9BILA|nr:unnamed protein product [Didymodactylos carnosus]CAF0792528.1 unnamed protein product [Didymodactylos carnosus]CAF3498023.1 unnamed protein product [Didymodactylos carnosus]CAF3576819.1 unnamed protein product [Didymodactylos carnosus]
MATQTTVLANVLRSLSSIIWIMNSNIGNNTKITANFLKAPVLSSQNSYNSFNMSSSNSSQQEPRTIAPKMPKKTFIIIENSLVKELWNGYIKTADNYGQIKTKDSDIDRFHEQVHNEHFDRIMNNTTNAVFVIGIRNLSTESSQ